MDSLLASYASSDEEKDEKSQQSNPPKPKLHAGEDTSSKSSGFFSSFPPPKSKSSLFSLPPPKSNLPKPPISSSSSIQHISNKKEEEEEGQKSLENPDNLGLSASFPKPSSSLFSSLSQPKSSPSSSLFSSLPQPKTHDTDAQILSNSSLGLQRPAAKRVVQFRPPPINPSSNVGNEDEDEDDESEEEEKKTKQSLVQTSSVKSFLSSIPAPRNSATLGALPSASGTGRRSIIDADVPGLKDSSLPNAGTVGEASVNTSVRNFEGQSGDDQTAIGSRGGGSDLSGYAAGGGDYSSWGSGSESFANYAGYGGYVNGDGVAGDYQNYDDENVVNYSVNYENYANYEQYERNWADGSTATVAPEVSGFAENALRVSGKRGRNNTPQEIIEVKQDELMKNRPREDQVKLTGIAFGPAYQPTSTKGKPTKLHKRKHQIGSLYFDMKQKEMELAERRAQGFLTKAQTQGKYGW